ncbi:AAA family ATPase [Nonomuraea sp. NPDC050404]|uniref:AAA family ATPase n=1 Tax=Nonomuraea sp. NPDC050404 TaxID=3155783 RepID=UPI0033EF7522
MTGKKPISAARAVLSQELQQLAQQARACSPGLTRKKVIQEASSLLAGKEKKEEGANAPNAVPGLGKSAVDEWFNWGTPAQDFRLLWSVVRVLLEHVGTLPSYNTTHAGWRHQFELWKLRWEAARVVDKSPRGTAPPPDVPFTLPPGIPIFVGRDGQPARLREALDPDCAEQGLQGAVIDGMAGVGKTSLALHIARETVTEGWFSGGALFVDLQGYDKNRSLSADQAAAELLCQAERAEGTSTSAWLDAYHKMLRTAPGPMLIVLDNASSAGQVSPLRPSGRGHRMLVTSRYKLPVVGLRKVDLGVMTPAEGTALIRRQLRVGDPRDARMEREPAEAARLVGLCGCLPLALFIVAALLEIEPDRPLARLADELTGERSRLELLHTGDAAEAPVRAAFTLSYRHLGLGNSERGDALRRLFSLLPLGPFPDPSTPGAAAMFGRPVEETRPLLRELARAHLIEPGRRAELWRMHDLIRLYALELCMEHMSASERSEAFKQAGTADMYRVHRDYTNSVEWAGRVVARFNGWGDALAWPDAERSRRLLHVNELAERTGHADARAYLAAGIAAFGEHHLPGESLDEVLEVLDALMRSLDESVKYADSVPVEWDEDGGTGTDESSGSTADELLLEFVSRTLADVAHTVAAGRYDEAIEVLTEAAAALRHGPPIGPFYEACVLLWIGEVRTIQGRISETRQAWHRAIELLTEAGNTEEAERLRSKLRRLPGHET